ncbi:MAG TPA: ferrous iron transport protein B, partial [Spirochaetota bacterium]|nr:ferrous iron transport protein B [Spirochaetota bacterium]
VIKNAPLKDPIEYRLMGYNVSLRRSEAALIDVDPVEMNNCAAPAPLRERHGPGYRHRHRGGSLHDGADSHPHAQFRGRRKHGLAERTIRVALVGNPNSGKTTLFNNASGSREHVGNYCGVTISAKKARFNHDGRTFLITDLPGTYSISAYTPEELFVRDHLLDERPDVVINVIDASNLERNLYLTTQLIDMGHTVVIALTMSDEMMKRGDSFNHTMLGKMLGIPFVPTVGPTGEGIDVLFDTVAAVHEGRDSTVRQVTINYGPDIESALSALEKSIAEAGAGILPFSPRFAAIKLLEKDPDIIRRMAGLPGGAGITIGADSLVRELEIVMKEDCQTLLSDARYGFIAGALRETLRPAWQPAFTMSDRIDRFLTHQVFGFPIFLFFMWATFQLTFTLGQYPMDWIESGVVWLSGFVSSVMPAGLLRELITDGIIAGVGGVIVFLPNILILFFMISLMEDTGYMSRAAFIMDRLMHGMGLHGKSFIPLIMGFGCNVPAIMATRTLESRKDRLLTMMIIPFMSCSARLPIFVLLIGAFFSAYAGTVLFLLYITGILVAVLSALLLKKTLFRSEEAPFVMELPPYRAPRLKNTLRHMWSRALEYLKKIGGIVLVAAILIWALGRFPYGAENEAAHEARISAVTNKYALEQQNLSPEDVTGRSSLADRMSEEIRLLEHERDRLRLEGSVIGHAGRLIEPAVSPLGFDWKMGVSLLTGFAAKEISVSTLGVLYHPDRSDRADDRGIEKALKEQRYGSGPLEGRPVFDPLTALGYMLFMLLYVPCVATLAAMKKESGSLKWPVISALYSTTVAWLVAFLVRQSGRLIG